MVINGTDLAMIRGDNELLVVEMVEDDAPKAFENGDKVYFTVKAAARLEAKLIQKLITVFTEGAATVVITPEDTKPLKFGTYVYDIQATFAGGMVKTIVPPSTFEVLPEVTYE